MVVECASRMRCRCSGAYSPPDAEAPTEDTVEGRPQVRRLPRERTPLHQRRLIMEPNKPVYLSIS